MPRGDITHIAADAGALLKGPAATQARADMKEALYQMWLDCDSTEDRERVWGIASGFEMYWRIMERYDSSQTIEELGEQLKEAVA